MELFCFKVERLEVKGVMENDGAAVGMEGRKGEEVTDDCRAAEDCLKGDLLLSVVAVVLRRFLKSLKESIWHLWEIVCRSFSSS